MALAEMRVPVVPIQEREEEEEEEEAPAGPLGDPPPTVSPQSSFHLTAFVGRLLVVDQLLFLVSSCCCVVATVVLFLGGKWLWSGTLLALLLLLLLGGACASLGRGRQARGWPWDRSIDRFLCGFPLAFFCLYAQSVTHPNGGTLDCSWYIKVDVNGRRRATEVGLYGTFLVATLSLALGALRMDCGANSGVSQRAREGRWYVPSHTVFRAAELSFRLTAGVFLCESLRVYAGAASVSPPLFLCVPFACLLAVYMCIYQRANAVGDNPLDGLLPCLVVSAVTLALNPMHFFARPGYEASAREANKWLFIVRACELLTAIGFVYTTAIRPLPADLCIGEGVGMQMLRQLGLAVQLQLMLSLLVHYLIMVLHGEIQHSTNQNLVSHEAHVVHFPRDGRQGLYVPPPPVGAGLCQAWLQLGGGLPLAIFAVRESPQELDQYKILSVLGGGGFGVVVQAQQVGVGPPQGLRAMKLLNMSGRNGRLARREAEIYSQVWLNRHLLADGLDRVGHPFIVRLHFYSSWAEERQFFMHDGEVVRHPRSHTGAFHMALMMEHCDGNLEHYLRDRFRAQCPEWFALAVRLLAEILLGLAFLHEQNVAYRDLKPENVLTVRRPSAGDDVHCKLGDFGYGRLVDPQEGERDCSVCGTPYFCAPEMEELARSGVRLRANQEQEKALDSYSYGTVAFVMAKGPAYLQEPNADRLGNRVDHPRCHVPGATACQECRGCRLLAELGAQLRRAGVDPEGHLADVVAHCVPRQPARRAPVQSLRGHALFRGTDFDRLLGLEL